MQRELSAAFAELDAYEDKIPGDALRRWVAGCDLTLDDVAEVCRYHPEHYVRNLLRAGPSYHALVLCWRNGQRSHIHDHRGSGCAVKVLSGEAIETTFATAANGMVYPTASGMLEPNATCYSEDSDIHQVSNLQDSGHDLVTLHVYSPPLLQMNVYSLHGRDVQEFYDPINDELTYGGGI